MERSASERLGDSKSCARSRSLGSVVQPEGRTEGLPTAPGQQRTQLTLVLCSQRTVNTPAGAQVCAVLPRLLPELLAPSGAPPPAHSLCALLSLTR